MIYPVTLLVHVLENILSQTIKSIKMEVNYIKGSDVSFDAKSLQSHGPEGEGYGWLSFLEISQPQWISQINQSISLSHVII